MTSVNSVNSFEGKQKFSAYDLKRAEKIAIYSLAGDTAKAGELYDEFKKDKKNDKIRDIVISALALVATVTTGRALLSRIVKNPKISKYLKPMAKGLVGVADAAVDLFRKKENKGQKVVTNFLKQDIGSSQKARKFVKGTIDKLVKNEADNKSFKEFIKNAASFISEKTKVKKYKDLVTLGAAAGIGTLVDEPLKDIANSADDGRDMNLDIAKENWEENID